MAPKIRTKRIARRVIIYVRVSSYAGPTSDDRAAANQSPEVQERRCRAFAEAKGWTVIDVVRDLDVSGSKRGDRLARPGLAACRTALRDGTADVILALRLDRLARNTVDLLTLAEEADELGAALAVVEGGVDMTDAGYGRFVLTLLAALAELEAYSITARTMDGRMAAREQGRWIGQRRPPFGYRKAAHPSIPGAWTLALDDETAPIAREIAARLLAGETAYSIAQELDRRGVRTQSGAGYWRAATVRHIWLHPAMVGRHYWQGDVLRDADGMPRTVFPPVLDLDDWHNLRVKLRASDGSAVERVSASTTYLLSGGVARCASCGGPMNIGQDSAGNRRYRCARTSAGAACPRAVSAPQPELDALVAREFLAVLGGMPVTRVIEVELEDTDRAEVLEALNAAESTRLDPRDAGYRAKRDALDAQIAGLLDRLDTLPAGPRRVTRTEETGEAFAALWARSGTDERRAMLLDNIRVVVARAERIPGVGHYDTDLSKRVRVVGLDEYNGTESTTP